MNELHRDTKHTLSLMVMVMEWQSLRIAHQSKVAEKSCCQSCSSRFDEIDRPRLDFVACMLRHTFLVYTHTHGDPRASIIDRQTKTSGVSLTPRHTHTNKWGILPAANDCHSSNKGCCGDTIHLHLSAVILFVLKIELIRTCFEPIPSFWCFGVVLTAHFANVIT